MPRNRKLTTQKVAWATQNLEMAVNSVTEKGKSIHRVAKAGGTPYSTHFKKD
jgi:hypothetical protein